MGEGGWEVAVGIVCHGVVLERAKRGHSFGLSVRHFVCVRIVKPLSLLLANCHDLFILTPYLQAR